MSRELHRLRDPITRIAATVHLMSPAVAVQPSYDPDQASLYKSNFPLPEAQRKSPDRPSGRRVDINDALGFPQALAAMLATSRGIYCCELYPA